MTLDQLDGNASQEPLTPQERRQARDAGQRIGRLLAGGLADTNAEGARASLELRVKDAGGNEIEVVALPLPLLRLLDAILEANANGHAVTVMPSHGELTPNQGAEMLGVSRSYLIKLLDEGKIPFRRVGAHRRIRVDDLNRYQEREEARQLEVLAALQEQEQEQAQELDMGY